MKTRTTRKALKERFTVLNAGDGLIDNLLCMETPSYYCTRVEGWAFDAWIVNNDVALTTGYAPIGKKIDTELLRRYDTLAKANKKLYRLQKISREDLQSLNRNLITQMLEESGVIM